MKTKNVNGKRYSNYGFCIVVYEYVKLVFLTGVARVPRECQTLKFSNGLVCDAYWETIKES